ncbi:hypothetical protein HDV00_011183 [Rhizophlyctis rosea]|nr:hypothetical protein HDV00_011183 [Rhizophlyctis rosea]
MLDLRDSIDIRDDPPSRFDNARNNWPLFGDGPMEKVVVEGGRKHILLKNFAKNGLIDESPNPFSLAFLHLTPTNHTSALYIPHIRHYHHRAHPNQFTPLRYTDTATYTQNPARKSPFGIAGIEEQIMLQTRNVTTKVDITIQRITMRQMVNMANIRSLYDGILDLWGWHKIEQLLSELLNAIFGAPLAFDSFIAILLNLVTIPAPLLTYLYLYTRKTTYGLSRRGGAMLFLGLSLDLLIKLIGVAFGSAAVRWWVWIENGVRMYVVWVGYKLRFVWRAQGRDAGIRDVLESFVDVGQLTRRERESDEVEKGDWMAEYLWYTELGELLKPLYALLSSKDIPATAAQLSRVDTTWILRLATLPSMQFRMNYRIGRFAGMFKPMAILPVVLGVLLMALRHAKGKGIYSDIPSAVMALVAFWQVVWFRGVEQDGVDGGEGDIAEEEDVVEGEGRDASDGEGASNDEEEVVPSALEDEDGVSTGGLRRRTSVSASDQSSQDNQVDVAEGH